MSTDANIINELLAKSTDQSNLDDEFKKDIFDNIFFKNMDGLLSNANKISFNKPNWEQNPKQFCIDQYNEANLYKLILLVNNIQSLFAFKSSNFINTQIYAPRISDIYKVLSYV